MPLAIAGIAVVAFVYASRPAPLTRPADVTQEHVVPGYVATNSAQAFELGSVIPGLKQHVTPQGLAFTASHNRILISHYADNGPSFVSVIDNSTGDFLAAVRLQNCDGTDHTGHVGGIAVAGDWLFAASDSEVLRFPLSPFVAEKPTASAVAIEKSNCETNADFAAASGTTLFVGEFAYGSYYPTDETHHLTDRSGAETQAWVCAYDLGGKSETKLGKPSYILSIPDCIQGMCVVNDRIYLSMSFGRRYDSKIYVYRDPRNETAHDSTTLRDNTELPLWFLDDENLIESIELPPMAEGIALISDRLAVLTESAAQKYRFLGAEPVDRLFLLDLK